MRGVREMDMGRRGNAESVLIAGNKTSEDGPANQCQLGDLGGFGNATLGGRGFIAEGIG